MLHKSKGKYRWSRKATYSVDWGLSPVILAYLEKLYETIKDRKTIGVPQYYCQKQADVQGIDFDWSGNIDLEAAHQLRLRDLEELIYVFNPKNEPDIIDYGFKIDTIFGDMDDRNCRAVQFKVTGEDEHTRYHKDLFDWEARKKKGQELFGQIYSVALDW